MIILFILGLVLGGAAVIFALENTMVITVTFFSWQLTSSLAVILISAILAGVFITLLLLLPESISNYFKYKSLKKEIGKLEEELRKQKELTVFAKRTLPSPEAISKIEKGAIIN
jgi:lipopolysaccharide assembly protein A